MLKAKNRLNASRFSPGDTLIEVLFAITVFSLIVVSALAIMNQGSSASRRSLETSLVRQEIDNQSAALRFLQQSYVTNYQKGYSTTKNLSLTGSVGEFYKIVQLINTTGATSASPLSTDGIKCPKAPNGSFVINTKTGTVISDPLKFALADTYSQLTFDSVAPGTTLNSSDGLWIEGIKSPDSSDPSQAGVGYIDFHIRACWSAPGLGKPMNLGTIVRLYVPRS